MSKEQPKYLLAMTIDLDRCGFTSDGDSELSCRVTCVSKDGRKDDCQHGDLSCLESAFEYDDKRRDLYQMRFHAFVKPDGSSFGGRVSFDAGSYCDCNDVRRMFRAVTRIEKALEKMRVERGYSVDVAEEFGRVASAIGCMLFLEKRSREGYDRSGYRFRTYDSVGDAVNQVRYLVAEIKQKHLDATTQPV